MIVISRRIRLILATLLPSGVLIGAGARETASAAGQAMAPTVVERVRELRLVVAEEGNEARYRVREQLARIDFPSDAVGLTNAVSGGLVIADDGSIVREESRFVVDLTGLTSDSDRRDGYIQRRTLETELYPTAVFVPTRITGVAMPPQSAGEMTLMVTGDLTIHGATRSVTWEVTAQATGGAYTGTARTAFTFDDFGMTRPRVAAVLSVADTIRLEYDFRLERPQAQAQAHAWGRSTPCPSCAFHGLRGRRASAPCVTPSLL